MQMHANQHTNLCKDNMETRPQISWGRNLEASPVPQQAACPQACPVFPFVWVLNLRWAPRLTPLRSVMQVGGRQPGYLLSQTSQLPEPPETSLTPYNRLSLEIIKRFPTTFPSDQDSQNTQMPSLRLGAWLR